MYIVQFSELDELIDEVLEMDAPYGELFPLPPVFRVIGGEIAVQTGAHNTATMSVAVHVRAVDHARSTILSCMVVIGHYQKVMGRPFGPDQEKRADELWAKVAPTAKAIRDHIQDRVELANIGKGVLHLGLENSQIQPGTWAKGGLS